MGSRMKLLLSIVIVVMAAYIGWSQYALSSYRSKLETEQKRVYNIADNFQLVRKMMTGMDGKLDPEKLNQYRRGMKISEITRPEALSILKPGEKLYTMTYPKPDNKDKKRLDRYFSDLVLYNYYYIKTDSHGKIIELFWDKP